MKYKTTKRAVMGGYQTVISIGYCNAQHLLRYVDPVAYTTMAEGWGADIYQFGNVAIVTGYAPFGNVKPDYDTVRMFDREAEAICSNSAFDWSAGKARAEALIRRFVDTVAPAV